MKKRQFMFIIAALILCLATVGVIGYKKQQRTREVFINKAYFLLTDVSNDLDAKGTEDEVPFWVYLDLTRLDTVCKIYREETRGAFHYYDPGIFGRIVDDIYNNAYDQNELTAMASDMREMIQALSDESGIAENPDLSNKELNGIFEPFYERWEIVDGIDHSNARQENNEEEQADTAAKDSISATDKGIVTINGKIYKVYDTVNIDAMLTELYNSIEEFNAADSVEAIVKGTVKSVSYEYLEHCPFTVYTLEISDCYKGMLNGIITVYEDGGYIPLSDMQEDLAAHAEGFMDEINIDEYAMDMIFMGAEHVQIGDTLIAYLVPTSAPMRENSYRYVSSVFGRFVLADGVYERTMFEVENQDVQGQEVENNFENIISAEKMESVLKNIEQ